MSKKSNKQTVAPIANANVKETPVTMTTTETQTDTQTQTATETQTDTQTVTETATATETQTTPEAASEEAKPSIWERFKGWMKAGVSFVANHDVALTCGAGVLALGFGIFGMTTFAAIFGGIALVGLGMFLARTFSEGFRSFFGLNKPAFKKAEAKKN